MREYRYRTPHGIEVTRTATKADFRKGLKHLLRDLDRHRGIYLSSGYEYPGRYSRWDIASTCPPLEIVSYDRQVQFRALNERGERILEILRPVLEKHPHWDDFRWDLRLIEGRLKPLPALFTEEERSKQPSAFSVLRSLIEEFRGEEDSRLGLVGAHPGAGGHRAEGRGAARRHGRAPGRTACVNSCLAAKAITNPADFG